jgi:hypothetical protein
MKTYPSLTNRQQAFVDYAMSKGHDGDTLTRSDIVALYNDGQNGIKWPRWITESADRRLGRGMYHVPEIALTADAGGETSMEVDEMVEETVEEMASVSSHQADQAIAV